MNEGRLECKIVWDFGKIKDFLEQIGCRENKKKYIL